LRKTRILKTFFVSCKRNKRKIVGEKYLILGIHGKDKSGHFSVSGSIFDEKFKLKEVEC
jgi:hypothetical protein